jgi:pyridoxamine 5'-phosphate oxidase
MLSAVSGDKVTLPVPASNRTDGSATAVRIDRALCCAKLQTPFHLARGFGQAVSREHPDGLDEADLGPDPIAAFQTWLAAAVAAEQPEPTAMTLATADASGRPSARTVLLKKVDERGFTWFTNGRSRKGRELAANPRAALVFAWIPLGRQVTVLGPVDRLTEAESDAYFATRPLGSRLGAWASDQSEVLPSRETLEVRVREIAAAYPDGNVPRPPHWGGYRLWPIEVQFWQHRDDRLHDRLRYRRVDNRWMVERLAP